MKLQQVERYSLWFFIPELGSYVDSCFSYSLTEARVARLRVLRNHPDDVIIILPYRSYSLMF